MVNPYGLICSGLILLIKVGFLFRELVYVDCGDGDGEDG
jgi:hypothetical protein